MYPSYHLDLDLVREATGVHWEEFLVVTCRPGTPSMMLKHTFAFVFKLSLVTKTDFYTGEFPACSKKRTNTHSTNYVLSSMI